MLKDIIIREWEGSISQFRNTVGRGNLEHTFTKYLTLISKCFMMSRLSDFVVCSTNLYIWSSGINI